MRWISFMAERHVLVSRLCIRLIDLCSDELLSLKLQVSATKEGLPYKTSTLKGGTRKADKVREVAGMS